MTRRTTQFRNLLKAGEMPLVVRTMRSTSVPWCSPTDR